MGFVYYVSSNCWVVSELVVMNHFMTRLSNEAHHLKHFCKRARHFHKEVLKQEAPLALENAAAFPLLPMCEGSISALTEHWESCSAKCSLCGLVASPCVKK